MKCLECGATLSPGNPSAFCANCDATYSDYELISRYPVCYNNTHDRLTLIPKKEERCHDSA